VLKDRIEGGRPRRCVTQHAGFDVIGHGPSLLAIRLDPLDKQVCASVIWHRSAEPACTGSST
jgi:hypothetical protein